MGRVRPVDSVKLICGLLAGDEDMLRRARQLLTKHVGPIDMTSDIWPFTQTSYYEADMGPNLLRMFVAFRDLALPDRLIEIKHETNALEEQVAADCAALGVARPVNLDPGYVQLGKLVLASTKDASHRVYLGAGIYGEVTLTYAHDKWHTARWTYLDYQQEIYHEFFTRVRERLRETRATNGTIAKNVDQSDDIPPSDIVSELPTDAATEVRSASPDVEPYALSPEDESAS